MKKIILTTLCIAVSFISIAQVGVGTTNPEGALDIVSSNSGLILPRVANTAAVTTPVNGMIIYDISTQCTKTYQNNNWTGCLSDASPKASSVTITGNLGVGATLTGIYTYTDINNDAEGTSTFRWYRADDALGANRTVIATGTTYTLVGADEIKYIAFEVTPIATSGTTNTGTAIVSAYQGLVTVRDIETVVQDVVLPISGQTWMDRNLGATAAATLPNSTDPATFGDLYQWGRNKDGHEDRTNLNTDTGQVASSKAYNGGLFIEDESHWTHFSANRLWEDGINDPCPSGYRVPTKLEMETAFGDFSLTAEYRLLNIPLAGFRHHKVGDIRDVNSAGYLWSAEANAAPYFFVDSNGAGVANSTFSYGYSVRCIKE
jgi:hypothetical protein